MTYTTSHPWLSFSFDTRRIGFKTWLKLGEASSKSEHIGGSPLSPENADKFYRLYLAKGALATSAIEGNTLTEEEAIAYFNGELKLPPSREYLGRELDNIANACNQLTNDIADNGKKKITPKLLKWMNKEILEGLELEENVQPGVIRKHSVVVGRYRCPDYTECDTLIDKFCDLINGFPSPENFERPFTLMKAIIAHLYLVWIHPFGDGNGRTARLLELYILLSAGFPQPTGHILSNHYNKTRTDYYRMLDNASKHSNGIEGFITYSVNGFVDGVAEQIKEIRGYQFKTAWIHYAHKKFKDLRSSVDNRRLQLLLSISDHDDYINISRISMLTPELAKDYANKTIRVISRDVNVLYEMGLIYKEHGRIKAKKDIIEAFKPWANT